MSGKKVTNKDRIKENYKQLYAPEIAQTLKISMRALKDYVIITDFFECDKFKMGMYHYHPLKVENVELFESTFDEDECVQIKKIRGIAIRLDTFSIEGGSFPKTEIVECYQVPSFNDMKKMNVNIKYIRNDLDKDDVPDLMLLPQKVGTVIRCFEVEGHFFTATHKKFNIDKSKFKSDKTFKAMFFEFQNCFKTPEEIFGNETGKVIHTFMLSTESLNMSSRTSVIQDCVYYLTSFVIKKGSPVIDQEKEMEMRERITAKNSEATKPIIFPETVSEEEANKLLNPSQIPMYNKYSLDAVENYRKEIAEDDMVDFFFQESENVIVRPRTGGIYTLASRSTLRRMEISKSNAPVIKTYIDILASASNGFRKSSIPIIPYGYDKFALEELYKNIKSGKKRAEPGNFYSNKNVKDIAKTNLFFTVPLHLLDEVMGIEDEFSRLIMNAVTYFFDNKVMFRNYIRKDELDEYCPAKIMSKHFKDYLMNNFLSIFTSVGKKNVFTILELNFKSIEFWPEAVRKRYEDNEPCYITGEEYDEQGKEVVNVYLIENAIISLIMNSGTAMYKFLTIEGIVTKFKNVQDYNNKKIRDLVNETVAAVDAMSKINVIEDEEDVEEEE